MIEKAKSRAKGTACETWIKSPDGTTWPLEHDIEPRALAATLSARYKRANSTTATAVKARLAADLKRRRI